MGFAVKVPLVESLEISEVNNSTSHINESKIFESPTSNLQASAKLNEKKTV